MFVRLDHIKLIHGSVVAMVKRSPPWDSKVTDSDHVAFQHNQCERTFRRQASYRFKRVRLSLEIYGHSPFG